MDTNPYRTTPPGELETLLVSRLPSIRANVKRWSVRYHLADDDVSDLFGSVTLKLIADDYGVFRRFRGRSTLRTYLETVIRNQCRDHVGRLWGRWQPSRKAEKLGPVAVELERLTRRDGHTDREAIMTLLSRTKGASSEEELEALALELPARASRQPPSPRVPMLDTLEREQMLATRARCRRTLDDAVRKLDDDERNILTLRFAESLAVPAIAARLGLAPRALYSRLERILRELARALEAKGLDRNAVLSAVPLAAEDEIEPEDAPSVLQLTRQCQESTDELVYLVAHAGIDLDELQAESRA